MVKTHVLPDDLSMVKYGSAWVKGMEVPTETKLKKFTGAMDEGWIV